ncbi:uncharacterized protein BDZ99DRAFT_504141 [Mytilinidion resinicola]|uniref:Ankyrin n=1 Tax=Mytilinidion resinicola TaxID=574789 RepID=A0A6A6XZZ4_9PEZI|nr:uncharacterized protein BDZ99DRAFT_504141 [Mytilinidion resinicola]KAF2802136.1 hypothetical protein BDZ99DRAFT_504141 [Mytilinidion resinicola]
MAEPQPIQATCLSLLSKIGESVTGFESFEQTPSSAPANTTPIVQELESLQKIVRTLARDATRPGRYPPADHQDIISVLQNCGTTITELGQPNGGWLQPNGEDWSYTGKSRIRRCRLTLENQKSILSRSVRPWRSSGHGRQTTTLVNQDATTVRQDVSEMIATLQRIHGQQLDGGITMQRYLDELTTYAKSAYAESAVDYDDQSQSARSWDGEEGLASPTSTTQSSRTTATTDQGQGTPRPPNTRPPAQGASSGGLVDREKVLLARTRRSQLSDEEREHLENCLFIMDRKSAPQRLQGILAKGTDPNAISCLYKSHLKQKELSGPVAPLAAAIISESIECFKILLEFAVYLEKPIYIEGWGNGRPLAGLIYRSKAHGPSFPLVTIKLLLEASVDVNARPRKALILLLLQHGADIETARTCTFWDHSRRLRSLRSVTEAVTPQELWNKSNPDRNEEINVLFKLFGQNGSSQRIT